MNVLSDPAIEAQVLAAYCQDLIPAIESHLFTDDRLAAALVFEQRGKPPSASVAKRWLAEAGVKSIDPRPWFAEVPAEPGLLAEELRKLSVRRRVVEVADEAKRLALQEPDEMREIINQRWAWAFAPLADKSISRTEQAHDWLRRHLAGEDEGVGYTLTWCPTLAEFIGPLGLNTLLAYAGQPGIGKSSFAAQVALDVAQQGGRVLYCSPDMGVNQTLTRMVATVACVPFTKVWRHKKSAPRLSSVERVAVEQADEEVQALDIRFEDTSNTLDLCSKARSMGADLLIADYLGKFGVPGIPGHGWLNQEQATASVFAMRALSSGQCAAIILSHTRNDIPDPEHMAWTKELGRQCDVAVWALEDEGFIKNLVLKARGGPTGEVALYFYKPLLRFVEPRVVERRIRL